MELAYSTSQLHQRLSRTPSEHVLSPEDDLNATRSPGHYPPLQQFVSSTRSEDMIAQRDCEAEMYLHGQALSSFVRVQMTRRSSSHSRGQHPELHQLLD